MEDDPRIRKCSSCKLILPSQLFKNENTSYYYKTCLPCRYKKRLKYYSTLSNVPLYKRDRGDELLEGDTEPSVNKGTLKTEVEHDTPIDTNTFPESIRSVVPSSKWIKRESTSSSHVFIASAVLTPITLEKYVGNSRKYSIVL
ncbi:hypothetical protein WA538_002885 [Blastocystis sp. DL]